MTNFIPPFRAAVAASLLAVALPLTGATAAAPAADAALPDSALVELPEMTISGEAATAPTAGRAVIEELAVTVREPGSLADLGGLLPSARVSTNSRGESVLMIRGAPERHAQAFLDGIPLNLPWDERTDLGTIPITGGARVEGRRGLPSLLAGPGVLAGSVRILPERLAGRERETRIRAGGGAGGLQRYDAMLRRAVGDWAVLGAANWRERDALPVPDGVAADPLTNPDSDERFNSDLRQGSALLRASRPVAETGRLNLLATGWSVEKGVPPEMHVGEDARFWRYPERRRALLGASLHRPLGASRDWDLTSMAAVDFFRQEIDPRGPDGWDRPLEPGEDYETDLDRTGRLQLGLTRWLRGAARVSVQADARYTHHRESLVADGPELAYAQWLSGLVTETEWRPDGRWTLLAGAGWDHSHTPESGDKARADSFDAPALSLRAARGITDRSELYASVSRRSRFPSLRELYSGALGKFLPNPDLVPERQDLLEIGGSARGPGWEISAAGFVQTLHDGIEKQKLHDGSGRFQRVNRTGIRVPGVEASCRWRPVRELELGAQHTILSARVEQDGDYDQPAEDRPDYLSLAEIGWQPPTGPNAHLEALVTGPRWSADATDDVDGLRRLPAGVVWTLRLGWAFPLREGDGEIHVRVANVFDQRVDAQVGLPNVGRTLSAGATVRF